MGVNCLVPRAGQLVPAMAPFSCSMVIDAIFSISCIFFVLYFVVCFLLRHLLDGLTASMEELALVLLVLVVGGLLRDHKQRTEAKQLLEQLHSTPTNPVTVQKAQLGNVEEAAASIGEEFAIARIARWQKFAKLLLINSYKKHRGFDASKGFGELSCLPPAGKMATGKEMDTNAIAKRESARVRQIMIGKSRPEYQRCILKVPPGKRPSTPDPHTHISKRHFDRMLFQWRRQIHELDKSPAGVVPSKIQCFPQHPETIAQMVVVQKEPSSVRTEEAHIGVMQLALEDRLSELPPSPRLLTLADKLDTPTRVDDLPDAMKPKDNHCFGPQSPEDKMMPQPLPHDEKAFPQTEILHGNSENSASCTASGSIVTADSSYNKRWRLKNRNMCKFVS